MGNNVTLFSSDAPSSTNPTANYWSGYHANGMYWTRTNTALGDPASAGTTPAITQRTGNIVVTQAASSLPGITWTPQSSSAVYWVEASFQMGNNAGDFTEFKLTDGTNIVNIGEGLFVLNQVQPYMCLKGIYAPASGSAVTLKIQVGSLAGQVALGPAGAGSGVAPAIEWSIFQMA